MGRPFDLHVLSTPPAFVLSQDQTLHVNSYLHEKLVLAQLLFCKYVHQYISISMRSFLLLVNALLHSQRPCIHHNLSAARCSQALLFSSQRPAFKVYPNYITLSSTFFGKNFVKNFFRKLIQYTTDSLFSISLNVSFVNLAFSLRGVLKATA